jgi:protein O-mannosyl-transferase
MAIVGAALAAYATGIKGAFVYDDIAAIVDNPTIRHFSWAVLIPPAGVTTSGRPLLNLSLAANYAIGGLNVAGYHFFNVAVHIAAAVVLWGLIRQTLRRPLLEARFGSAASTIALLIAVLWAVHPLETEAVTYTVQRAESLMGFFYLATLYCFARSADSAAPGRWLGASVIACVLGMASKEVMVSAPVLVFLYDRTFVAGTFREAWRKRRAFHLSLAATWVVLLLLVWSTGWNRNGTVGMGVGVGWWAYGVTQFRALTHYLSLTLWPHPLVFDYGTRWETDWLILVPHATVVMALVIGTLAALRFRPVLGFLGLAFLLPLAPTSLLPGTTQMIVEHRMYLSLAPLLVFLVAAVGQTVGRRATVVGVVAVAALAVVTAQRNRDYRNDEVLWADTVAKVPDNARAQCNLAILLVQRGEIAVALPHYEASLRAAPASANTHFNYGVALAKLGRFQEAVGHYEEALRWDPGYTDARCNLGTALLSLGRPADALAQFERALAVRPNDPDVLANIGNIHAQAGHLSDAIGCFQRALRLRPADPDLHYNLGTALLATGDRHAAIAQLEEAARLRPNDPDIAHNLAAARAAP